VRGEVQDCLACARLPALPTSGELVGAFAGSLDGALVVAGGARVSPSGRDYSDEILVLDAAASAWKRGPRFPGKRAFGCSVTTREGVVCIGGHDARQAYANVVLIHAEGDSIVCTRWPDLPTPVAGACAALVGNRVYVAGGHGVTAGCCSAPLRQFFVLDLDHRDRGCQTLESWPGPARTYAVAAAQSGAFFLFGGARRLEPAGAPLAGEYLRDAYRFTPDASGSSGKWHATASPPCAFVGVPSPAPAVGQSHVVLLGADVPGLLRTSTSCDVPSWWYHTITNTWTAGSVVVQRKLRERMSG
jgi:N-acetylneuraminic acid mutarotase